VTSAFAVKVFAKTHIKHPVQFVFDPPVLADHRVQSRGIGSEAGDVVADLALGSTRRLVIALRLDTHQTL
jgi:hypothetical protein